MSASETNVVLSILKWMSKARPQPTDVDRSTQLGVHFEEITEMADAMLLIPGLTDEAERDLIAFVSAGQALSASLKKGTTGIDFSNLAEDIRVELLDSLCDQIVTALGSGFTQNMDMLGALAEVDQSNWSKFGEDGEPIFNEDKKVIKGPNYRKAVLDPFV